MRLFILKDTAIPQKDYRDVIRQFKDIYKEHAGIDVEVVDQEKDLSDLPYRNYYGNFDGIAKGWIATEADRVVQEYGKNRFDHFTVMVALEHWKPAEKAKIWGWNLSMAYSGLETQQVAYYDSSAREGTRIANTLGTLFHENMHAHDTYTYRVSGKKLEAIVGVDDWDDDVVHGEGGEYEYITHKQVKGLKQVAPTLKAAYGTKEREYKQRKFAEGITGALKGGAPLSIISSLIELFRNYMNRLRKEDQPKL